MRTGLIVGIVVMLVILAALALLLTQPPAQTPTPTTSPTATPSPTSPTSSPSPTPTTPPTTTPTTPKPKYRLIIFTGGTGGVYFPVGSKLAEMLNKYAGDAVAAEARTSGASVANANALAQGDANIAFIQNDIAYYAYNGLYMFDKNKVDMRGVISLYPETVQIVVPADSPIKSIYDLAGKKVAVGATGSGVAVNAEQILKAAGIWDKVEKVYAPFTDAANLLKLRQIDAAFVTAGHPTSAIVELSTTTPVRLIPIPDEVYNKLLGEGYRFYTRVVVPKGTYNGLDSDVQTVAVMAIIAARPDVPNDVVYAILKTIFDNIAEFRGAHARVANLSLEKALDGMSIPLHPGAVKFYQEKGLKIPTELLPTK
jgi:TRAP transporter TAXI family solute receptor